MHFALCVFVPIMFFELMQQPTTKVYLQLNNLRGLSFFTVCYVKRTQEADRAHRRGRGKKALMMGTEQNTHRGSVLPLSTRLGVGGLTFILRGEFPHL